MAHKRNKKKTKLRNGGRKEKGKNPKGNDDNSPSLDQLNHLSSVDAITNGTSSPQGKMNKERGLSQEEIDKRTARAERFGMQLDPSLLRSVNSRAVPEHEKTAENKESPSDHITDFFKVIDEYVKIQTLIKKAKESRQKNSRLVAWDFFHEESRPVIYESLYRGDKGNKRIDPSYDEEYIEEGGLQKKQKEDEVLSTPRFLDAEMGDVYQFLSPYPSSSKSVETSSSFTSQPEKSRKPSILQRLGIKGSITTPSGSIDKKTFDYNTSCTGPYVFSSADVEYEPAFENGEKLAKPGEFITTEQATRISNVDLIKEIKEGERDEIEVTECHANDDGNLLSPNIQNPKFDLCNWTSESPCLNRAESGRLEKVRKSKYKKPRHHDRRKSEKDRKERQEYYAIISENRDMKTVLDDNDRKKEALRAREFNSEEKTHEKLQDDYGIAGVLKELYQSSRAVDHRNSKVSKLAENEISDTSSV